MTGLFSKLNKRLPNRSASSEAIPIARVIHNQPIPENASAEDLDRIVTAPTTTIEHETPLPESARPGKNDAWAPLREIINDPLVTDLFLVQPDNVTFRRSGLFTSSTIELHEEQYRAICDDCESQLKARCKEGNNFLMGATISPTIGRISITHPTINGTEWFGIHLRIPRISPTFYDLIKAKMLPAPFASWLTEVLASRCVHLVVCGAPHSGKTTLAGTLAHAAPSDERIIALEPFAELNPPGRRLERLCYRGTHETPANTGIKAWSGVLEVALKNAPDRIFATDLSAASSNDGNGVSVQRILQAAIPTVLEFSAAAAEPITEYLRTVESPLPIVLVETQLRDRKPIVRQALEIAAGNVKDLVSFHSVVDDKRRWMRSDDPSVVRELLIERGHELKIGPTLLEASFDDCPGDE